jgi:hypothetical protein
MKIAQYPNATLRKKLLVAGIPESEHALESLLTQLSELDAPLLKGLSADMTAELLLYLISKGVVSLPKESDKAMLDLPWGSPCWCRTSSRGWSETKPAPGWSAI